MTDIIKKPRGFAAMDPEKARQIQSQGGKASTGKFTSDRAKTAGDKGREKRWGKK